jgi:hypothetical protein
MATGKQRYKKLVSERAQATKAMHKDHYKQILAKEKAESFDDIIGLYHGLSAKSRECIVYRRILELATDGLSPQTIIDLLQYRKRKKKPNE